MEQHPVPQHIASFEFKLFGNLTIRQFVTLAIPASIGLLIFFSPIPPVVRIPLALLFGGIGLLAALVPVGGRPLDKWLVAFIRAISSPTQRVWVKEVKIPEYLNIVISSPQLPSNESEVITTQDRVRLNDYLRSLPRGKVSPFDVREQIAIQRLNLSPQGASGGKLPPPIIWANTAAPQVISAPRVSMAQQGSVVESFQGAMAEALPNLEAATKISHHAKQYALPGLEKRLKPKREQPIELVTTPTLQLASDTNFSIENVIPITTPGRRVRLVHGIGKTRARKLHFGPPSNFDLSNLPIRGEARFEISNELKKRFGNDSAEPIKQSMMDRSGLQAKQEVVAPVELVHEPVGLENKTQISFIEKQHEISPTSPSTIAQIVPLTNKPNVLSGLVVNEQGTPLEGAILTVKDTNGVPVRALKTNKLGQFLSATPLSSGDYTLDVEGSNLQFMPITINLKGEIMKPFEIKAGVK